MAIVAPLVFKSYAEWGIGWIGGAILAVAVILGTDERGMFRRYPWIFCPGFLLLIGIFAAEANRVGQNDRLLERDRNFYGALQVISGNKTASSDSSVVTVTRALVNGGVYHGIQIQGNYRDGELIEDRRGEATTYYAPNSGVGRAIKFCHTASPKRGIRIGAIGLGAGTLAAYTRANDSFVFYEINPIVPSLADKWFTFLDDARQRMKTGSGRLEIEMGDARISLEREFTMSYSSRQFDVLAVDAFTGDAIPTHLLTREAGEIYARHLAPDGILAIHISNRYLDLVPVVVGLAQHLKLTPLLVRSKDDDANAVIAADWMLLTKNPSAIGALTPAAAKLGGREPVLWTDDFSNLFEILK